MSMISAVIMQYRIYFIPWLPDIFGNLYLRTQQNTVKHVRFVSALRLISSIVMHPCTHSRFRTIWDQESQLIIKF